MAKIEVEGWKVGFRKVSFTKMLRSHAGYTLSEAKHLTDEVMAGRSISIDVPDDLRSSIASEMEEIGALLKRDG